MYLKAHKLLLRKLDSEGFFIWQDDLTDYKTESQKKKKKEIILKRQNPKS